MVTLLSLSFTLLGCSMDDNSLEAISLSSSDVGDEDDAELAGTLTVTAGADEGDWTLGIEDATLEYHSPSRVDLGTLNGETVTLSVQQNYSVARGLVIADAAGPRFIEASTPSEDGTTAFGRAIWTQGDVIGTGTVTNQYDEPQKVKFTDVVVTTDEGESRLIPGEPTSVLVDGASWRFTVVSAYLAVNAPHMKCGAPDMLAVEMIRTEEDAGPVLVRPVGLLAPVGSCG